MSVLWLLGCVAGSGSVQVDVLLSATHSGGALEGARADVDGVSLRGVEDDWRDGWVEAAPVTELVFGDAPLTLATLTLPTGRYDHVSVELDDVVVPWICGTEPTVALALEPIAAPFRLGRDEAVRIEVTLLALAELADPSRLTLYAIDTLVE